MELKRNKVIPRNHALFPSASPNRHMYTSAHTCAHIHTNMSSAFGVLKFHFPASSESSFFRKLHICKEAIASSGPALLHALVTVTKLFNRQD